MTTSNYILRIDAAVAETLADRVAPGRGEAVEFVRLTTFAAIDTYGFDENSVGSVIGVSSIGLALTSSTQNKAPTVVVPWSNVASLSFAPTTPASAPPPPNPNRIRRGE